MPLELFTVAESKTVALASGGRIHTLAADETNSIQLLEVSGFNDSGAAIYWQVHHYKHFNEDGSDTFVVGAVAGTTALYSILVPSKSTFNWQPLGGFFVSDSGVWVASTAAATFEVGAEAGIWCLIKYVPNYYQQDFAG